MGVKGEVEYADVYGQGKVAEREAEGKDGKEVLKEGWRKKKVIWQEGQFVTGQSSWSSVLD